MAKVLHKNDWKKVSHGIQIIDIIFFNAKINLVTRNIAEFQLSFKFRLA